MAGNPPLPSPLKMCIEFMHRMCIEPKMCIGMTHAVVSNSDLQAKLGLIFNLGLVNSRVANFASQLCGYTNVTYTVCLAHTS